MNLREYSEIVANEVKNAYHLPLKELIPILARWNSISLLFEDYHYENYKYGDLIPEKFHNYEVWGIGSIPAEEFPFAMPLIEIFIKKPSN